MALLHTVSRMRTSQKFWRLKTHVGETTPYLTQGIKEGAAVPILKGMASVAGSVTPAASTIKSKTEGKASAASTSSKVTIIYGVDD